MRAILASSLAAVSIALAACVEAPASENRGTDETSASLLSSVRDQAERTPAQSIDIALLGFDRGRDDAPVRIIEMSDYGCGYCREFHQKTFPLIREQFIDVGKVEWKFLPFVNGMFKNSPQATHAAECALEQGPEQFETMSSAVWDAQREWKQGTEPERVLRRLAEESDLDLERYDACTSEGRRTQRVDAATALANQVGVRGTPTFFVVGYPPIQGALPTDAFLQVLTMVYAEATKEGGR